MTAAVQSTAKIFPKILPEIFAPVAIMQAAAIATLSDHLHQGGRFRNSQKQH